MSPPSPADGSRGRSASDALATGTRTLRAAGVAGIAFAILFSVAVLLLRGEAPDGRSQSDLAAWLETSKSRWLLGTYLLPFAGIAFLWFVGTIRTRIGEQEDQFLATVFLASGVLFVAMIFVAGAAVGAPLAAPNVASERADPIQVEFGRSLGYSLMFNYGVRMAAVFMLVSSTIGRQTRVLPSWFTILGIVTGLILLITISSAEIVVLIFPAWVAIASTILLVERRVTRSGALDEGSGGSSLA